MDKLNKVNNKRKKRSNNIKNKKLKTVGKFKDNLLYSEFIFNLRRTFNIKKIKMNENIIMDKEMEYEDFIKIIISKNLCSFDTKHWKKYINIVNSFDNTYPLFWACEHSCLDEVKLLLENGVEFIPEKIYDKELLDRNYVNKDCLEIIFSMISFDNKYDVICFKKFFNMKLNNNEIRICNNQKKYKLIIEELMNKYDSILDKNYFHYNMLKSIIVSNDLDLIKYFFENINLYSLNVKIQLFNNFLNIIKILSEELQKNNDYDLDKDYLCYKEFRRIKIIFIIKLISKFFKNCGIENYYFFDNKMEEIIGTYKNNIKFNYIEKLKKKLEGKENISVYKNICKLFDNLIEKYNKELIEFLNC